MLKTLLIKDYALIENLQAEFGKGLNIITGETGAGKSIIIDAMGLLLGERASSEVVRDGAQKSIIEGIFDIEGNKKIYKFLEENEIDAGDELIMRREISLKGTNRCFLNDTPVTLNLIKETGDLLVDLHGQHEHQSLLRTETHIEMLDEFAGIEKIYDVYKKLISELSGLTKEYRELLDRESALKEKRDIYEFQAKEIDAVSPLIGEEENLLNELKILENSENIIALTGEIYGGLYEDENAVIDKLGDVKNKLAELAKIDKQFEEILSESGTALSILNDISSFVRSYKDKIDIDPNRLEEIRSRLSAFNLLKKKYGGSIEAVLNLRDKIEGELNLADNFTGKISSLEKEIELKRIDCGGAAKKMSVERKSASKKIKKEIEEALKFLGIQDSRFETKILNSEAESKSENYIIAEGRKYKFDKNGMDEVEFFVSTNLGEEPKPLVKVASGGEISRIMLALKSILAKSDRLPILIFDEIDTGVSGRIAQKVGQVLKSLASRHQIIAITHLPQIAGLSDIHFAVEKKKAGDRVVSSIRELSTEEKIKEVAKLMSGERITEAAITSARELMGIK